MELIKMRHFHHHPHHFHRGWRRRYWRRGPRIGRLIGMAGLAALGYTLLDKQRREQTRQQGYVNVDPNQEW
jgi:hypothetical protein